MTPEAVALTLVAVAVLAALVVFWRLTNSRGTVTWELRTLEPEENRFRVERDEARREAEKLREQVESLETSRVIHAALDDAKR